MDLSSAQREHDCEEFKGLSLRGGKLAGREFVSCSFVKCSFREAAFEECTFRDCTFRGCDLSLARFKNCAFVCTRFEDSQLVGINWTEAGWAKKMLREPVHFVNCALNHSVFAGLNLRSVSITRCVARDVDFSDSDLTRADCTLTDFFESRFQHTNLTEADFSGATNYMIGAHLNTLRKTKFSLPEAMSLLYGLDIILAE
jgi:fluoroquinolone resistance protein